MGLINAIRRYWTNSDIEERRREVLKQVADGKSREARALRSVAAATGDQDVSRKARKAEQEAEELRQRLADVVAVDVISGRG